MSHFRSAISPQESRLQREDQDDLGHTIDRYIHGMKALQLSPLLYRDYRHIFEFPTPKVLIYAKRFGVPRLQPYLGTPKRGA